MDVVWTLFSCVLSLFVSSHGGVSILCIMESIFRCPPQTRHVYYLRIVKKSAVYFIVFHILDFFVGQNK
ncbi:NADH dehydrogenase [ubiquinone] flavoprotein 1 [Psidium guajava]|nr:NADH dehydrogenase [ubiquinone] flavoprotein 1 [Psidium guajava]